jgi:putative ABC transport system permease protein
MHEWKIPFFLINRHIIRGSKWTLMLIIFLMAIAFINMVFVTSLFNGIIDVSDSSIIETLTGNIVVSPPRGEDVIKNGATVLNTIRHTAGVTSASAHYSVPATLIADKVKGNFRVIAIDPEDEKNVTEVSKLMVDGKYLDPNDRDGIILGYEAAGGDNTENRNFKAKVGDQIKVQTVTGEKMMTVRGIFHTKYVESDLQSFITTKGLRDVAPTLKNKPTSILVKTEKTGGEAAVVERIKAAGVTGAVDIWTSQRGLMKGMSENFVSIDVLLSLVATLIAAVTIFIVIYIDVSNKRQQIGVLRALGVRPYLIHTVYVIQSAIYSMMGISLGTALFFAILVPYFIKYPFSLPLGDAHLVVNYANFIGRAELIILVALLSGLIPAMLVTRMNMLDEIRGK